MFRVERRRFLVLGAGLSGAALARAPRSSAAAAQIALDDPGVALRTYVKLRGSTAPETVFQPYEGDIFLVADGREGIPLCGFKGIQKSTWNGGESAGFSHVDYDIGFYVDYSSRKILESWHNPLTDKTVEVFHYRSGPSAGRFAVGDSGQDVYGGVAGRWFVAGGDITHTTAHWGERPNPLLPEEWPLASSGKTVLSSMSLSYSGRIADVLDPALHSPRTIQVWTHAASWMPWMEMGQRPGFNLWRWIGVKGVRRSELAADLVAAAEAVWPGYIAGDGGWQVPTYGALDYMRAKRGLKRSD